MFTFTKGWYQSKTVWTSIVGFAVSVLAALGFLPVTLTTLATASSVLFVLAGVFRITATSQIGSLVVGTEQVLQAVEAQFAPVPVVVVTPPVAVVLTPDPTVPLA